MGDLDFDENFTSSVRKKSAAQLLREVNPQNAIEVRRCKLHPGLKAPRFQVLILKMITVLSI